MSFLISLLSSIVVPLLEKLFVMLGNFVVESVSEWNLKRFKERKYKENEEAHKLSKGKSLEDRLKGAKKSEDFYSDFSRTS